MKSSHSKNPIARLPSSAFTLVEVLVALALLSMVVLTSLYAQQKVQRQMALTSQRIEIISKLDALLTKWVDENKWPDSDSGPITGMPGCEWRRSPLEAQLPPNIELVEVKAVELASNHPPRTICRVQAFKPKN